MSEQMIARRQSPDPLERYWTWPWQTRALFALGGVPQPILRAIEPCAGAGWMVDVLTEHFGRDQVAAFDVQPDRADVTAADTMQPGFFEQVALATERQSTALITNPPFSLLASYARRGRMFGLTALLGRITWLEPTKDREDIRDPDRVIVLPRTSFGGPSAKKSSDSATAAWFIWGDVAKGIARVKRSDIPRLKSARSLSEVA